MAEEFLGKRVNLSFIEKKARVKVGKVLEINDLGIVFQVEDYRKGGDPRSVIILQEDITSISEALPKKTRKKATAKPATTPVAKAPVEPEPEPASTEAVSSDLVDDDDFDDVDDLDFEND